MEEPVYLDTAIFHIRKTYELSNRKSGNDIPYFFVVGAGISKPPIPLASELIDELRQNSPDPNAPEPAGCEKLYERYSFWFRQAYDGPEGIRTFIEEKMLDKPISEASLYLASILCSDRPLARVAITTNFDDFISRCLSLFGRRHRVIDTPKLLNRFDHNARFPQVVHLHGMFSEYDLVNTEDEIAERANETWELVKDLIQTGRRTPLILGYSGWERDAIMTALKRALYDEDDDQRQLIRPIYWFCYKRSDMDELPQWLREHKSVAFVVPRAGTSSTPDAKVTVQEREAAAPIGSDQDDDGARLPASEVLRQLSKALDIAQPEIFADPIGHFLKQIKTHFPFVRTDRIERAREMLHEMLSADLHVSKIVDELHAGDYADSEKLLRDFVGGTLRPDKEHVDKLNSALSEALHAIPIDAADEKYWTRFIELLELYRDGIAGRDSVAVRGILAKALLGRGSVLAKSHDSLFRSLPDFDRAVQLAEGEPSLAPQLASGLVNRGFVLSRLGSAGRGLQEYERVIKEFADSNDPDIRACVARAMINKAFRLGEMGREDPAHTRAGIAQYQEVVRRFEPDPASHKPTLLARRPASAAVTLALNGMGFLSLVLAKQLWQKDKNDPEIDTTLENGLRAIECAARREADNHMILGNQSYIVFLRAKRAGEPLDAARALLRRAIEIGGEEARGFELCDAGIAPIPEDEEFVAMVRGVDTAGAATAQ